MTDPTARDLVKRLADDLELWLEYCGLSSLPQEEDESFLLLKEARAYLAQPEAERPTPISLTKRQPTEADCDADGQCWFWHPDHKSDEFIDGWMLLNPKWADGSRDSDGSPVYTHWLPYSAIPLPEVNP